VITQWRISGHCTPFGALQQGSHSQLLPTGIDAVIGYSTDPVELLWSTERLGNSHSNVYMDRPLLLSL
jgi:hypothetical protein